MLAVATGTLWDRLTRTGHWEFVPPTLIVENELLRLHQFRKVHYEVAGSIVQLELPCRSVSEYTERLVA
jgi:hypothetical protein